MYQLVLLSAITSLLKQNRKVISPTARICNFGQRTAQGFLHRQCKILDVSATLTSYDSVWKQQHAILSKQVDDLKINNRTDLDYLLCVQHDHVYTLGQSATNENIKFDIKNEIKEYGQLAGSFPKKPDSPNQIFRVERGGDVTYHGPGQLVVYPIFDLRHAPCGKDLRAYLTLLEEAGIRLLKSFGLTGYRRKGYTGVWVVGKHGEELGKIQAIGVKVRSWITMHGLAFNVNPNLAKFDSIVPCGLPWPVCSLQSLGMSTNIEEAKNIMLQHLQDIFHLSYDKALSLDC